MIPTYSYCWLLMAEIPNNHLKCWKHNVNRGMNDQPQLLSRSSSIHTSFEVKMHHAMANQFVGSLSSGWRWILEALVSFWLPDVLALGTLLYEICLYNIHYFNGDLGEIEGFRYIEYRFRWNACNPRKLRDWQMMFRFFGMAPFKRRERWKAFIGGVLKTLTFTKMANGHFFWKGFIVRNEPLNYPPVN